MVVPERTRKVYRVAVPFFLVKLSAILVSLCVVFLVIIGMDYVHVLRGMAENKALKGENFKLRREIQLIRNKVDAMESTIERVRNYAKKLQLLTGQGDKEGGNTMPWEALPGNQVPRSPAAKPPKGSRALDPLDPEARLSIPRDNLTLTDRVEGLRNASVTAEYHLTKLQIYLLAQSAFIAATPSLLPINGWLSSTFGYRRNPYDGSYRLHAGVDIAADPGAPVRAPAMGTVIYSGFRSGYGKVVVIDHGYGIRTLFAHNSKIFVTTTQKVKRGEKIAEVGSTGHSTGPHLHYEVRKNGMPVNPVTFFSGASF
jgi:murein DD-endopeptidase MepM/ murein hydrolase activator NlpD